MSFGGLLADRQARRDLAIAYLESGHKHKTKAHLLEALRLCPNDAWTNRLECAAQARLVEEIFAVSLPGAVNNYDLVRHLITGGSCQRVRDAPINRLADRRGVIVVVIGWLSAMRRDQEADRLLLPTDAVGIRDETEIQRLHRHGRSELDR